MLKDEKLEYILEQYEEKNEVLRNWGEQVKAVTLYDDIYSHTDESEVFPFVIIDENEQKHIVKMPLYDGLEMCEGRNDVLLGGCTFYNGYISKNTCKDVCSFIIDMDNVYSGTLLNALQREWRTANDEVLAQPTYIVNSGTGLHLYFVLDEPIPNYRTQREQLDKLYRALAIQQTTKRVYLQKQVQWFGQDFRMAGGLNKYDKENTVFKYGKKWNIDELAKACGLDMHFIRYGEKRTKKPSNEPRSNGHGRKWKQRKGWRTNEAFYNYALRTCRDKTKEGNRYTSLCALACIAWKCGIYEEQVEKDMLGLLPDYNKGATRLVKPQEIRSALKMYNDKAILAQRERLEEWQGWEYKPIKRNHRKRATHLKIARFAQELKVEETGRDWREGNGRPNKQAEVEEWKKSHPSGTVTACARDLNISRPTVYKYF